jgi:hypothetical protein
MNSMKFVSLPCTIPLLSNNKEKIGMTSSSRKINLKKEIEAFYMTTDSRISRVRFVLIYWDRTILTLCTTMVM